MVGYNLEGETSDPVGVRRRNRDPKSSPPGSRDRVVEGRRGSGDRGPPVVRYDVKTGRPRHTRVKGETEPDLTRTRKCVFFPISP